MEGEGNKMKNIIMCGHCGNTTAMSCLYEKEFQGSFYHPDPMHTEVTTHTIYKMLLCPVCRRISLIKCYWDSLMEEFTPEELEDEISILYPTPINDYPEVPTKVNRAFQVALRSRYLDPTLCMVALRRTLEMICKDKGFNGGNLNAKLKSMTESGLLPSVFNEASHIMRKLGNAAAHGDDIEYSDAQAEEAIMFMENIINYIYVIPEKINRIQSKYSTEKQNTKKG